MFKKLRASAARIIAGDSWNTVENNAVFNIIGTGRKTNAGLRVSEFAAITIPAVWAANSLVTEQIAQCPVALYKREGEARRKVTDHPIALMLMEPNTPAGLGMPNLLNQAVFQGGLWGDGYWQIERGASGAPVALWPLDSEVTQAMEFAEPGRRGVASYRTIVGKQSVDLDPGDVVHFRRLSLNGFTGLSPVDAAREGLALALAAEKFGAEFFKNDAMSGGVLMHPGKLSADAKANVRSSLEDQAKRTGKKDLAQDGKGISSGKEHHRLTVLEEGMKFIATTIPPEQAQFLGTREFQIAEVARMYRVPLVLLQSLQGSTVWGTGIEQLMIGFVNQTIRPLVVSMQDEMTRKLLTAEERADGYEIDIDESVLLVGDALSRANVNNIACGGPWRTRNEARHSDGLNPLPGLDEMVEKTAPGGVADGSAADIESPDTSEDDTADE